MKIYTRTGDSGETGLFAGPRVSKDSARIEAYGTVDELNAVLAMARLEMADTSSEIDHHLFEIQNELFDLGAQLATPDPEKSLRSVSGQQVARLELWIDQYESRLEPLKNFILPGGSRAAAQLHLGRTVCRRAERRVVTLMADPREHVPAEVIIYLNRLSDLLFVMARAANRAAGIADVPWQTR